MTEKPLTDRQLAFVLAYVGPAKGVGVQAAKQAGYAGTEAVLDVQARRLLGNARIKLAIEEARAKSVSDGIMTATEVAVRLSGIAMGMVTEKRVIGGSSDFAEVELPAQCGTQIEVMKVL